MSKIKLSELTELITPSSNTKNTYFIVTDIETGTPVSKKMSAFTLDTLLDVSQGQANLAFNHANSAFIQSNSAYIHSNSGFTQANAAFIHANSGFIQANAAFTHSNSGFIQSNAAFLRANNSLSANVGGTITGDVSITGNLTVAGVTTYVNTQTVLVADNILTLNAAINQSGTPISDAGIEIDRGNEANVYILWNETSNKWTFTIDGINYDEVGSASASSYANSGFIHSNSAFIQVNAAFDVVNTSAGIDITQNNNITAAFNHANSSFIAANNAAFDVGTVAIFANTPSHVANSASIYANGALAAANTAEAYAAANLSTSLWATSPPITVREAIERLANVVIVLNGYTPIP
jgi:hypothetical protein